MPDLELVVNNKNGRVIHLPTCPSIRHQIEHDLREPGVPEYGTFEPMLIHEHDLAAFSSYRPCGMCKPPIVSKRPRIGVHELTASAASTKHIGKTFVLPLIGELREIRISANGIEMIGPDGSASLRPTDRIVYRADPATA